MFAAAEVGELGYSSNSRGPVEAVCLLQKVVCPSTFMRYLANALEFQRPIFLISSVGVPAAIAELATPLRKELPEYMVGS
jgi:hypothetical protein